MSTRGKPRLGLLAALGSVVLVVLGTVSAVSTGATAIEPRSRVTRALQSSPTIVVTAVTPWVAPDGNFRVELRVDGPLPADATISSLVHQRLRSTSKTSLRASLDSVLANGDVGDALQSPITQPITALGDPAVGIVVDLPVRSSRNGDAGRGRVVRRADAALTLRCLRRRQSGRSESAHDHARARDHRARRPVCARRRAFEFRYRCKKIPHPLRKRCAMSAPAGFARRSCLSVRVRSCSSAAARGC